VAETLAASEVLNYCRTIATFTEQVGCTTRTFLSPPMKDVHGLLTRWMKRLGMSVTVDSAGNLRGTHLGTDAGAPKLLIGSHLDTVPNAGAFDGILGVVLAIALIETLGVRRLPFPIEVVGFSDEEGVRFGVPFIGSRAVVGSVDAELLAKTDSMGITVAQAIRDFGLDPSTLSEAVIHDRPFGYLELHIEQGPVLDHLGVPLGIVEGICGQTRMNVTFRGHANHAGTTPMNLRRDALAGMAEWVSAVESHARTAPGLVATVGSVQAYPGASNVIAGEARASLDVRHFSDPVRQTAVRGILDSGRAIARQRKLEFLPEMVSEQSGVQCDPHLAAELEQAVARAGYPAHRMASGAGHDAMLLAAKFPVAMLFLRSPGGISHHPDESVLCEDVAAALKTGQFFLDQLAALRG
jgi:allantoate deiminase